MLLSRSFRRKYYRPRLFLFIIIFLLYIDYHVAVNRIPGPTRTSEIPAHLTHEKIFIVTILRNSEYMLRLYWTSALLSLVRFLGPENVYVSLLESGSFDDTKGAARDLEVELTNLGVEHRIVLGEEMESQRDGLLHVPPEGMRDGWVFTGRHGNGTGEDGWEKRRIPHLAELRNRAMEPFKETQKKFDRVLWINDVVFTNEDVATLLSTRDGEYAAACAMDFSGNAQIYYDTFALRDSSGMKTGTQYYPYFLSDPSRQSALGLQPIPLQSCWNGLISMAAEPFYKDPPLKFRGIPDSLAQEHLEGSECCLIHADNHKLRAEKGVWMNPNVRVTYNASTYVKVNPDGPFPEGIITDHWEVLPKNLIEDWKGRRWPGNWEIWAGTWRNRRARWLTSWRFWSENAVIRKRLSNWMKKGKELGETREEQGVECLVNEMQVLYFSGWQHV